MAQSMPARPSSQTQAKAPLPNSTHVPPLAHSFSPYVGQRMETIAASAARAAAIAQKANARDNAQLARPPDARFHDAQNSLELCWKPMITSRRKSAVSKTSPTERPVDDCFAVVGPQAQTCKARAFASLQVTLSCLIACRVRARCP